MFTGYIYRRHTPDIDLASAYPAPQGALRNAVLFTQLPPPFRLGQVFRPGPVLAGSLSPLAHLVALATTFGDTLLANCSWFVHSICCADLASGALESSELKNLSKAPCRYQSRAAFGIPCLNCLDFGGKLVIAQVSEICALDRFPEA
jgi:hypothetical protein